MKKPVDPRKSIPAPRKFLSKLKATSAECNGELTVNHILNSIKSLPDNLDLNSVYVELSQKTIWTNNSTIKFKWEEQIPNPNYDLEIKAYNDLYEQFVIDIKAYNEYERKKISKEKEDLADEIARLRQLLADKEAELASKNDNS